MKPETRVFFGAKPGFDYVSVINKEMQLFEATKKRRENLEKIYRFLLTIRPTSVEVKRTFSAMGLFATKIRSRLNDDTLNSMIVMRQFYKKLKISIHFEVLFLNLSFFKIYSAK